MKNISFFFYKGKKNDEATVENNMAAPQKIKQNFTVGCSDSTSGLYSRGIESGDLNKYLYTHVHKTVLHKNRKVEATLVLMDEEGKETWDAHAVESYSVLKRKGPLTPATL